MTNFERQSIAEKLFTMNGPVPETSSKSLVFPGINQIIVEAVSKTDIDIRRDLFSNIILTGGTTMMKGIPERIQK
jgi:actin-related protein